jgi:hypothetical protein
VAEDDEGTEGTEGPSGLRKHAKQLEKELGELRAAQERDAAELQRFRRERAFGTALAEAKVEGVSLEDVGDLPADQITPALVRAKAAEKEDQRRKAEEAQAKALGFDSLDEYRDVLRIAQERKAELTAQRQAGTAAAMTGAGREPEPDSPGVVAYRTWEESVKSGRPADLAQADFVGAKARAAMERSGLTGGQT